MRTNQETRQRQTVVYAETILGSPRARCARFGICKTRALSAEAWAVLIPASVRIVKTRIWVDKTQQLHFAFQAASVSPIAREYFFATPFFKVDVAKKLPAKICKMLGIESFVIQPGMYEWKQEMNGDFGVCFGAQKMEDITAPEDKKNGMQGNLNTGLNDDLHNPHVFSAIKTRSICRA